MAYQKAAENQGCEEKVGQRLDLWSPGQASKQLASTKGAKNSALLNPGRFVQLPSRHPERGRVDAQLIPFLDAAAQVMAGDLGQHFVLHRPVHFGPLGITKLPLD